MSYQLGVDLGTTYTAAAICRPGHDGTGRTEVVSLGTRATSAASVLFLGPDGVVLVGEAAERR
ncbi:MAG: Hsp70 family protein, partial [Kutzneria sp.]|nr:Hsp70 family protein [Kutzneria sp.]